jgi:hypothetical protein
MKMVNLSNRIWYLLAILNALPLLVLNQYFISIDGSEHIYNAVLIKNLLFHNTEALNNIYKLNAFPVPYWVEYFMLILLSSVMKMVVAEKVLMFLYLFFLPVTILLIVKRNHKAIPLHFVLVFPFCYSYLFLLGFYSFSIAICLLFLSVDIWYRIRINKTQQKRVSYILLYVLLNVIYFSHVVIFIFTLITLLILEFLFELMRENNHSVLQKAGSILINMFRISAGAIPAIICTFFFLLKSKGEDYSTIPIIVLVENLKNLRPFITYGIASEYEYTRPLFYVILAITLSVIILRFKQWYDIPGRSFSNFFVINDVWIILSIFVLVLYFILPDVAWSNVRLGELFFIFFIVWLFTHNIPKWLGIICFFICIYSSYELANIRENVFERFNEVAVEYNNMATSIEDNKVVLPIVLPGSNWLTMHFSNYLGCEKPRVILENQECTYGFFPVKWNDEQMPDYKLGSISNRETCVRWRSNKKNRECLIDYILTDGDIMQNKDSCYDSIRKELLVHYHLVKCIGKLRLFALI